MKNLKLIITSILTGITLYVSAQSQPFARWSDNELVLDNGLVRRTVSIDKTKGQITTSELKLPTDNNMVKAGSSEFSFLLNGIPVSGAGPWNQITVSPIETELSGSGALVKLTGKFGGKYDIEVLVKYIMYPGLPLVRKKISIKNLGQPDINIESVDMESVAVQFDLTNTWILKNYCRTKHFGPYKGNWDDPALAVHELRNSRGIIVGNEAMGVLKRSTALLDGNTLTSGLNHAGEDFPFRKWLKTGQSWESPYAFTIMYNNTIDPLQAVNTVLPDFVRRHMGARTLANKNKPVFMFNTWYPTVGEIDEKSVSDWIDIAAECGAREFVLDAGWSGDPSKKLPWTSQLGDWTVDSHKFPNGLKPLFDKIKAKGMKPGMWFSIGSASRGTKVLEEHPEWFVQDKEGNLTNLHNPYDKDICTACLTTGWYDYIKNTILKFVHEYDLKYLKLDLSVVTSAYVYDNSRTGCYAKNHNHRDHEESYWMIYQRTLDLFDELHAAVPGLYIDCTFETAGRLQLIDYAIIQHAEGDWISNFEEPQPVGAMRVRHLAYSRSPVIPSTALVIGNMPLNDPEYTQIISSLIGSMPIFLGDIRKLKNEDKAEIKKWADWIEQAQNRCNFMNFRQDLPGFGEPAEGKWDGYSRINTENGSGGVVGVFKQGGIEISRNISINGLNPGKVYEVKLAPGGKTITKLSGKELAEKGFPAELKKTYDSAVFEIVPAN